MVPAFAQVEVEVIGSALGAHPGAEIVGIVRAAGELAQHLLLRPVLVPRLLPCGECEPCRRGRIAICATLAGATRPTRPQAREILPARFLLPLEPPFLRGTPELDKLYLYAALADALLAPYSALVRAGVSPNSLCAVLGGGFRAAFAVLIVRAIGAQAVVIGMDPTDGPALCAQPYGALAALDGTKLDPRGAAEALRRIADEHGLPSHGLCLLETSGSDFGRARALGMLEAGGTAVLLERTQPLDAAPSVSLPAEPTGGPGLTSIALLERTVLEGAQIIGAGPPHPDLLPELLALMDRSGIDLSALTFPISPSDVDRYMAERRSGKGDRLRLPIVRYPVSAEAPVERPL